jgi:DNA mismatch repair protein MSH6
VNVTASVAAAAAVHPDRWPWLVERRDKQRRRPDEPGYDPTTLHIPYRYFSKLSATRRQFWEYKRAHMDVVMFFQVGGFYELYEDDAFLGEQLLGLKLTRRPNMSSVGMPIAHYEMWASKFVAHGYKVARFDQSETVKGGRSGGGGAAMTRELTQMLTAGTLVDSVLLTDHEPNYLLAVLEECDSGRYGVCLLDAAVGRFQVGQFSDDEPRTLFETLLHMHRPKELVYEKGGLSPATRRLLRCYCPQAVHSAVNASEGGFAPESLHLALEQAAAQRSEPLLPLLAEIQQQEPLSAAALGGCVTYLQSMSLDQQLLSQQNFVRYTAHAQKDTLIVG